MIIGLSPPSDPESGSGLLGARNAPACLDAPRHTFRSPADGTVPALRRRGASTIGSSGGSGVTGS
ncbi:hypothetical protein ABH925_005037 [Streptacidiphilus sp. EB129]